MAFSCGRRNIEVAFFGILIVGFTLLNFHWLLDQTPALQQPHQQGAVSHLLAASKYHGRIRGQQRHNTDQIRAIGKVDVAKNNRQFIEATRRQTIKADVNKQRSLEEPHEEMPNTRPLRAIDPKSSRNGAELTQTTQRPKAIIPDKAAQFFSTQEAGSIKNMPQTPADNVPPEGTTENNVTDKQSSIKLIPGWPMTTIEHPRKYRIDPPPKGRLGLKYDGFVDSFPHPHRIYKVDPPKEKYITEDAIDVPPDYWKDHIPQVPLNFTRTFPYLGILIDAGRHYFEIDWLYQIMDILHLLQFNYVHFRLTDDQTFNVKLESWPQLAIPTPLYNKTKVYTPDQLRKLVQYAKARNITMIPEINVPGHAAAWANIPGLVIPCPQFACTKGYGVPLDISHFQLRQILKDVLSEVLNIFDNPPFLHLGGDEIEVSKPCFAEVGRSLPNYQDFDNMLRQILKEITYDESKVIRWEMTLGGADPKGNNRAGRILQWWFQIPGEKHKIVTRPHDLFMTSSGLYFDADNDDSAYDIYLHTRKFLHLKFDYRPLAIVVGTFELDQEFWFHRNVLGRLVAVAMGSSSKVQSEIHPENGDLFYRMYRLYCDRLGFPHSTCAKYGKPNYQTKLWKEKRWKQGMWKEFKEGLCQRLTLSASDELSNSSGRIFRPEFLSP